jgi:hypothetical protein
MMVRLPGRAQRDFPSLAIDNQSKTILNNAAHPKDWQSIRIVGMLDDDSAGSGQFERCSAR